MRLFLALILLAACAPPVAVLVEPCEPTFASPPGISLALAAAPAPDPVADPEAFVLFAIEVWRAGGWVAGVGIGLMILISLLRLFGERWFPALQERRGKLLLAIGTAGVAGFLGSLAVTGSIAAALGVAMAAIVGALGAFSGVKNAVQG